MIICVVTALVPAAPARKRALEVGYGIDNVIVEECSACGDPHFVGLDGSKYDFQGIRD